MQTFTYRIEDEVGIHARPAGLLVKKAKDLGAKITIECNGKSAEATKLMAIMSLGVRKGMEITVRIEGENEETTAKEIEAFFKENL